MDYIAALQNHSLKVTPQRLEIVDLLYKHGHMNVDDLYKFMQQKFPSLSLATIYKNIHKMCETLFVSEVKIPNQKSVYELTKEQHAHVVCTKCNAIVDINLNTTPLLDEVTQKSHYHIEETAIVFNGICPNCIN